MIGRWLPVSSRMNIEIKRKQLKEISAAIENQFDALKKIEKPHLHHQYEEMKATLVAWKQQQSVLTQEIMDYNRKSVPSPLQDERFMKESEE